MSTVSKKKRTQKFKKTQRLPLLYEISSLYLSRLPFKEPWHKFIPQEVKHIILNFAGAFYYDYGNAISSFNYDIIHYDFSMKAVLIGDPGVGKSSVLMKFASDKFIPSCMATVGVDFDNKVINVFNKQCRLQIWDTAGAEKFKTITTAYYRGCDAILIVFDVSNRSSFEHVKDWLQDIDIHSKNKDAVYRVIVANKCDIVGQREVDRETAETYANSVGLPYFEVSARYGMNITQLFEHIAVERIQQKFEEKVQAGEVRIISQCYFEEMAEAKSNCNCVIL